MQKKGNTTFVSPLVKTIFKKIRNYWYRTLLNEYKLETDYYKLKMSEVLRRISICCNCNGITLRWESAYVSRRWCCWRILQNILFSLDQ